jgi:hypothetical protein
MVFGKGADKWLKEERMKREKMDRDRQEKTKLELEIQQCSHMILNLKNLESSWINLGTEDAARINIGRIYHISEEDVICGITKKPCVLYISEDMISSLSHIDYHHLERCPSSINSVKKYKLEGIKKGVVFGICNIRRVGR